MTRNQRTELGCDERLFKQVVKTAFNQRRKMLRNSLKPLLSEQQLTESHPLLQKRPEQLAVDDFITLTNDIAQLLQ